MADSKRERAQYRALSAQIIRTSALLARANARFVVLEAEISKEGTIDNLKVITGHPLLIQAAIDAVKQWRYKPTMLNNEPVPVVTTITVNFAFSQ